MSSETKDPKLEPPTNKKKYARRKSLPRRRRWRARRRLPTESGGLIAIMCDGIRK